MDGGWPGATPFTVFEKWALLGPFQKQKKGGFAAALELYPKQSA
jgi:hypothetical protein